MRRMKITCLLVFLCIKGQVLGQVWTGNADADWNNSANWSAWPLDGDDITIDPANYTGAGASPVISSPSVFIPANIVLQNGAVLTIDANLSTGEDLELLDNTTSLVINSGIIDIGPGNDGRFIVSTDAGVTMNGGTLNCDQRLICELGGTFVQHDGTVTVGETFALGDGSLLHQTSYTLNNGSVTVNAEMGFENETGNFDPLFLINGGTLTVNGDLTWFGEAPGSGSGTFRAYGGNTIVNGLVANLPGSTINMHIQLHGSCNVVFNTTQIDMPNAFDNLNQTGGTLTITGTNTWNNSGVVQAGPDGGMVFDGSTQLTGTGIFQFNDLTINTGHMLQHLGTAPLGIGRHFVNNGTLDVTGKVVSFNGHVSQNLSGTSITSFYDMEINNSSADGLILMQNIVVEHFLALTDAFIFSTPTAYPILPDNAFSTPGHDSSFVDGPLQKTGDDSFVFPIGKNGRWARLGITAPVSTTSSFTAAYFNFPYSSLSPLNPPLVEVSGVEYWSLVRDTGTDTVKVALYWEDAAASTITSCTNLSIASWNGSLWNHITPGAISGGCTGTDSGSIVSDSAVTTYNIFTFGGYDEIALNSGETPEDNSINVYPNPLDNTDMLNISGIRENTLVTISDVNGRQVLSKKMNASPGHALFDISSLQSGIYLLTVSRNEQPYVIKLVVQ